MLNTKWIKKNGFVDIRVTKEAAANETVQKQKASPWWGED